jgi:hypothetical protein
LREIEHLVANQHSSPHCRVPPKCVIDLEEIVLLIDLNAQAISICPADNSCRQDSAIHLALQDLELRECNRARDSFRGQDTEQRLNAQRAVSRMA